MFDSIETIRTDSTSKSAVGISKGIAHNLNQGNVTKLRICKESLLTVPVVIYMKQDFYLLNVIDKQIKHLKASGLIEYWNRENIGNLQNVKQVIYPKTLTLKQFWGSFYILIIGWTISLIILMMEVAVEQVKV
jgi:hypothetical protein